MKTDELLRGSTAFPDTEKNLINNRSIWHGCLDTKIYLK